MFYSHSCSYCDKVFYTYNESKENAAQVLYSAIKQHLIEYDEDDKEHDFDDGPEIDTDEVYRTMSETKDHPTGGYEV